MSWTVHGLHTEALVFYLEHIDVIFVVLIMARSLPQLEVEDVGCNNFVVPSHSILVSNEFYQFIIDLGAIGVPETTAG
jgi:hypothetical protein